MGSSALGEEMKCGSCDAYFQSELLLEKHYMVAHDGKKPYFSCFVCRAGNFTDKASLQDHFDKVHVDRPYQCSHCDISFSRHVLFFFSYSSYSQQKKNTPTNYIPICTMNWGYFECFEF